VGIYLFRVANARLGPKPRRVHAALGVLFARLLLRNLALLLKTTPRQLTQRYAPFELRLLA
jgi:hypothetical protein